MWRYLINTRIQISIIVQDGNIQEVRADYGNIDVTIIDYDNIHGSDDPMGAKIIVQEEQEKHNKLPFGGF